MRQRVSMAMGPCLHLRVGQGPYGPFFYAQNQPKEIAISPACRT
jgi:hypothetical protein